MSFYDDVNSIFSNIVAMFVNPQDRLNFLCGLMTSFGYDTSFQSIDSVGEPNTNAYFRQNCLIYIAQSAGQINFQTITDAQSCVALISPMFEAEITYLFNNSFFDLGETFNDIKSKTILTINQQTEDLPYIVSLTTKISIAPCITAYIQYEDSSRDMEIIYRNNSSIIHPGFPPMTIQVLSY